VNICSYNEIELKTNKKTMLLNFILAIILIGLVIASLFTIDTIISTSVKVFKKTVYTIKNLKMFSEYIFRAYLRYKRTVTLNSI